MNLLISTVFLEKNFYLCASRLTLDSIENKMKVFSIHKRLQYAKDSTIAERFIINLLDFVLEWKLQWKFYHHKLIYSHVKLTNKSLWRRKEKMKELQSEWNKLPTDKVRLLNFSFYGSLVTNSHAISWRSFQQMFASVNSKRKWISRLNDDKCRKREIITGTSFERLVRNVVSALQSANILRLCLSS